MQEDEPILEGWLNSTLTTVTANSTADLIIKICDELDLINKTLGVFGIPDLLWSNNAAIIMKLHVSDWIISDIKYGIPPAIAWTLAKVVPNKGDISFLSQTALRAGALMSTSSNKKYKTNFLIPNGIHSKKLLTDPLDEIEGQIDPKHVSRIISSLDKGILECWKDKYLPKTSSLTEAVRTVGSPEILDLELLKRIVDILTRVSEGFYTSNELYSLYAGPYTNGHANELIEQNSKNLQRPTSAGKSQLRTFKLLEMVNMPFNIEGIDLSRSKMALTFSLLLGTHPLHIGRYTNQREIIGTGASAFNLLSTQMNDHLTNTNKAIYNTYLLSTAVDSAIPTSLYYNEGQTLKKNIDALCTRPLTQITALLKQVSETISKLIRESDNSNVTAKSLSHYKILDEKKISWTLHG